MVHDAEIARLFHHEPLMRQRLDELPRTSSREAFAARDALAWKKVLMDQAVSNLDGGLQPTQSLADDSQVLETCSCHKKVPPPIAPDPLNEFELYVMLERIGSMASDSRRDGSIWPQESLESQNSLILWHDKYRNTALFQSQAPSLMMLWHSITMLLYMDLDILECAAGREGHEMAEKHRQHAYSWGASAQAKRCIVHAILVQRQFEQMPLGTEVPIHAPMCLYRCGIAWHCFAQFGECNRPRPEEALEFPELESLGIDGTQLLRTEIGAHVGRSSERFLLRTVDLLRRISHWKIADSLSSTLLSLVEESNSVF